MRRVVHGEAAWPDSARVTSAGVALLRLSDLAGPGMGLYQDLT